MDEIGTPNGFGGKEPSPQTRMITEATLYLSTHRACERVISLAHRWGIATAMAYKNPKIDSPFCVLAVDERGRIEEFLHRLRERVPEARVSLDEAEVLHVSPPDSLSTGPPGSRRATDWAASLGSHLLPRVLGALASLVDLFAG